VRAWEVIPANGFSTRWLEERSTPRDHTLIRYDARGNGLSDRNVEDVSFETSVGDLEAVVEAAGLERFALLGISQGCAVAIAYAVRHPQRVSRHICSADTRSAGQSAHNRPPKKSKLRPC
jgi:pimeloyl-ACP methyl ester carboxylesterase